MDVEILLHGVPNGQDYYGPKEEQKQTETFYTKSNESIKFVIETKKVGSANYVYYTYLRYKGVIGAGGRTGSYLGITLRLDEYYTDVAHVYNMLDMAFKKFIVGSLMVANGDTCKYTCQDFASKKSEIDQLVQGIIQMIQTTWVTSKSTKIDNTFIKPVTSVPSYNIADITPKLILDAIKKHAKVNISPDYKSNLEIDCEKKMADVEGRINAALSEKDKVLEQRNTTITSLNNTLSSKQLHIEKLEKDLQAKNSELSKVKRSGDLSMALEKIKEPIKILSEHFRKQDTDSHVPTPKYGKKNFYLGIANSSLSAIAIILVSILLLVTIKPLETDVQKELKDLKAKYTHLQKEHTNLQERYDLLNADTQESDKADESKSSNKKNNTQPTTKPSITADSKIKNKTVKVGEEYTFSVEGYNGKGVWKVDGFKSKSDMKGLSISVTAIEGGTGGKATISYTPEGNEKNKVTIKFDYEE
ncbi:MAG: hypothetical protein J6R26_00970 [Paludibacteraceae bacterium]|nr:hypothetical protein [Paludibacteraceae bacterium]